jgi:hypothetical protein
MLKNLARIGAASVAAGALALLGLAGTAGASTTHVRPANTGSCGTSCVEPFTLSPGPQWVATDHLGKTATGVNGTIQYLQYRTSTNARQDYLPISVGTAADYCKGSLGNGSGGRILDATLCLQLENNIGPVASIPVEQLEYTPLGSPTNDCVGVSESGALSSNEPLRLQACNDNQRTFWVLAPVPAPGFLAINGGSTGTINAFVAAASTGAPALQPLVIKHVYVDTNLIFDSNELLNVEPGL